MRQDPNPQPQPPALKDLTGWFVIGLHAAIVNLDFARLSYQGKEEH